MKARGDKARFFPKNYSDSATIDAKLIRDYGQFIQSGSSKTFTLMACDRTVVGRECEFVNNGSGNLTVSCTGGFVAAVDDYTVATKTSLLLSGIETAPGTYKWVPVYGLAAAGSIPVKATGAEINTGTDDAKFATAKAIEDSDYIKAAALPVKATGAEVNTGTDDDKFVTAKAIADSAIGDVVAWTAFDPTAYITWAVATPAGMTLAGYYRLIAGTAEFKVYIVSADPSNNAGKIGSMTFPVGWQPKQLSMHYEVSGLHRKDTGAANTPTTMQAWIDASQAVAANRVITFMNAVVWADNEATELMFSGSFQYI